MSDKVLYVEKTKSFSLLSRFDYTLFVPVVILSIIGIFMVKSATVARLDGGDRIVLVQIVSLVIGIIIAILISGIDYKDIKNLGIIFYLFTNIMLILVLITGTGDSLGSRSWIEIGGISLQPSEFAKIGFIIISATFMERLKEENGDPVVNLIKLIIYAGIPVILVILQKDFGTTVVFLFIFFIMITIYGIKYKYLLGLFSTGLLAAPLMWFFVLNESRKNRFRVFLNPELDPLGAGFNVLRSKIAIGSGKLFGKGMLQGNQNKNRLVPVPESDFIFSVIGEEIGFIGSVTVILLIMFILFRIFQIAIGTKDYYGKFIITGILAMLGVHFIQNIGMTMGLFPVTGLPLPFVSAGGTSMITNYLALGFVLSISIRNQKVLFNDD